MSGANIDTRAAALTLRTLANPSRLEIVLHLLARETSVADLEKVLGMRQPNLSQHLGELRDAGLVQGRRESKSVFYSLAGEEQRRLVAAIAHGFGGGPASPVLRAARPSGTKQAQLGAVFATVADAG